MNYDFKKILYQVNQYYEKGLMCVPSCKNKKHPLIEWKNLEKENIKLTIKSFEDHYYNSPGIAILTGKRSNGLIVIDIDNKNDNSGSNSISKWIKDKGPFPDTFKVRTPNNGIHLYFYADGSYNTRTGVLKGVDIRAEGGLVIAPPTRLDSKPYTIEKDIPIAKANESVLKLLNYEKNIPYERVSDTQKIKEGDRTTYLVSVIGQQKFKGNKLSKECIKDLIRNINTKECIPPLSENELENEVFPAINNLKTYERKEQPKKVSLISMNDIKTKAIEWLIPGWIPKGKITLIGADGGTGKTFLWCHIVACLSAGKPCFFEDPTDFEINPRKPMRFLIFSSEDELEEVLAERLISNGANMNNILSMPYTDPNFEYMKFNSDILKNTILEHMPDGCIFDPLQSFLPPNVNMGYRNQMRDALNPLVVLGTETGTTMFIIMHTNKMSDRSGRGRFADSSDIFDIARSAFLLGKTKNGTLYLDHAKNNYAPLNKTVLYTLEDHVPKFLGSTEKKDWDFVHERTFTKSSPARDGAKEIILETLQKNGKMKIKDLEIVLTEYGVSKTTGRRARTELEKEKIVSIVHIGNGKKLGIENYIELAPSEESL